MPIQITWTAIPNGIVDGKLKIAVLASIKLTSGNTNETTLGASFPSMLNWHKNKFSFVVTFAGAMGVKTFNFGPISANPPTAWPATFKSETPVKPFKWDGPPIKKWESYSVTRILDQTRASYATVAQMSLAPKYTGIPPLLQNAFKAPDIYRSPFFDDRMLDPTIRPPGININPGGVVRPPEEDDDFGTDLLVASDYGTGVYGSAKEMLVAAYKSACDEWRNEGGEVPEDSALWWEARNFFEAYDEGDQGVQARPPAVTPQVRPGGLATPGIQSKFVDRYAAKPLAIGPPKLDFHEALGILGEHPQLMRAFGLLFDLEVPVANANLAPTGSVTVSASFATDGGGAGNYPDNPLTIFQYNAATKVFLPAHKPATTEYRTGFYNLGSEFVQITGVDVDSLTIRVLDFATLIRSKYALYSRTSLIHEMGTSRPLTATPTARPPTSSARPATTGATRPPVTSAIRPSTTQRPSPATTITPSAIQNQMIVSDALFQKMGDRPDTAAPPGFRSAGISIARKDRFQMVTAMMASANTNLSKLAAPKTVTLYFEDMIRGYRLDVFFKGKWNSLTTRQGSYTLPGNVPVPNVDEESWISSAVSKDPKQPTTDTAKIHEVMVRWNGYSLVNQKPGKTLDQQNNVIPGNTQIDPRFPITMQFKPRNGTLPELRFGQKYRLRLRLATVAGTGPELDAASPGAPYETPELTYRRWESVMSPALYEHAQSKEGESANHIVIRKYLAAPNSIDPTTRQMVPPAGDLTLAELHGKFDLNGKPDPATYAKIQERENMQPLQKYVGGKVTRFPFFSDPMALGVSVRGAPHVAAPLNLNYPGTWPENQSLQLEVRPGSGASAASGDKFTLFLTPGEIAFPKISSTIAPANAGLFGILEWVPAANIAAMTAAIPSGQMWTVTPFREVTALFATQVPEEKPTIDRPMATRPEASTKCTLGGRVRTHSWTTSSVDFNGSWSDDVDLIEEPRRTTLKHDSTANAFKLKIVRGPTTPSVFQPFTEAHEFGDSKHHHVTYDLVGHSPFKQYFPASWPLASNPEGTRFTETTAKAFAIHIPASKRPAPPQIEYVVPTFGWTVNKGTGGVTSSRSGNGLRVYIRRPWYSSGNDEKLAVCILNTNSAAAKEKVDQNTTKVGADPVFKSGDVPVTVTTGMFLGGSSATRGPTATVGGVGPAAAGGGLVARPGLSAQALLSFPATDIPGATATIVPYDVHFDDEKQMWYADIIVNTGASYTPFIRLALARYQPYAIPGLHLSTIHTADIMQLQNNRTASVVFNDPSNKIRASVTGVLGVTAFGPNRLFGTIEEKVGVDDETGWRVVTVGGKELSRVIPISAPGLITPGLITRPPTGRPPGTIVRPPVVRPPGGTVRPPEEDEAMPDFDANEAEEQGGGVQARPPVVRPGGVLNPQIRPQIGDLVQPTAQPGEFTLPKSRTQATYRLVIREYEVFHTDTGEAEMPEVPILPGTPTVSSVQPTPGARLVYMDVIPLS